MTIKLTSPVTGAVQNGFTSPTYTLTLDTAPSVNGVQMAVTAIGGTQAGVTTHSTASPFTITVFRPNQLRILPPANPVTGLLKSVPKNTYKVVTRKGAKVSANGQSANCLIVTTFDVFAGQDTFSKAEVLAAISAHIGALNQIAAGLGDLTTTGILS